MKNELFEELMNSIKEGGAIVRGDTKPSRRYNFNEPDVQAIRQQYGLTQEKFARMLSISVATLRNWEQGRRKPEGPAKVLLMIAAKYPKAILNVVHDSD